MIVITCIDSLRNANGHLVPDMAFGILFLSHLMRCNGTARIMATCCVIGWKWRASRWNLWFSSDFNFWWHLLKLFSPSYLLISSIFSPFFYNFSSSKLEFSLAFLLRNDFVFLYLNFTLFHVLMVDYSKVGNLSPSVIFFLCSSRGFSWVFRWSLPLS